MKSKSKKDQGKDRSHIEIRRDWCKGCGICVAFCPKKVLALDENEKAIIERPDECDQCGLCELRCPDIAIEITTL
ncbi:MAG: 4Fe-4S binding protein [Deltaproteobacteria bacterium]|nr:4Fe-4S binding protein [Deltaproteobacteria bacterium]